MLPHLADLYTLYVAPLTDDPSATGFRILTIIWVNVLLSGDNAVVIALACRSLPRRQRKWGIILGAMTAVVLRIVFTVGIQQVLGIPALKLLGGVLLLWISVQLLVGEERSGKEVAGPEHLIGAIRTVAIADLVMSLDNVLAIAAIAKDQPALIALGLALSIPLIVGGATILLVVLTRFPILVWAGAALLGWVAGGLIGEEGLLAPYFEMASRQTGLGQQPLTTLLSGTAAFLVLFLGWIAALRREATGAP